MYDKQIKIFSYTVHNGTMELVAARIMNVKFFFMDYKSNSTSLPRSIKDKLDTSSSGSA